MEAKRAFAPSTAGCFRFLRFENWTSSNTPRREGGFNVPIILLLFDMGSRYIRFHGCYQLHPQKGCRTQEMKLQIEVWNYCFYFESCWWYFSAHLLLRFSDFKQTIDNLAFCTKVEDNQNQKHSFLISGEIRGNNVKWVNKNEATRIYKDNNTKRSNNHDGKYHLLLNSSIMILICWFLW